MTALAFVGGLFALNPIEMSSRGTRPTSGFVLSMASIVGRRAISDPRELEWLLGRMKEEQDRLHRRDLALIRNITQSACAGLVALLVTYMAALFGCLLWATVRPGQIGPAVACAIAVLAACFIGREFVSVWLKARFDRLGDDMDDNVARLPDAALDDLRASRLTVG